MQIFLIKGTQFGWELFVIFFGDPGSKIDWELPVGVLAPDPQIPSLMP